MYIFIYIVSIPTTFYTYTKLVITQKRDGNNHLAQPQIHTKLIIYIYIYSIIQNDLYYTRNSCILLVDGDNHFKKKKNNHQTVI